MPVSGSSNQNPPGARRELLWLSRSGLGKGKAGLRIDSLESLRRGGNSGPAIVPGDPDASLLILAVRDDSSVAAMPPKSKLQPGGLEALAAWVKMGARGPPRRPLRSRRDVGHRIRRQVGRGDTRRSGPSSL